MPTVEHHLDGEPLWGAHGKMVAMADAGPLDITDRGSSMNNAAKDNFSEEERDEAAKAMMEVRGLDMSGCLMYSMRSALCCRFTIPQSDFRPG